jgi:protein-S-isoprenylcysteine O-methyltransferase Ste14
MAEGGGVPASLKVLLFPASVVLIMLAWAGLDSVTGWRGVHAPWIGWPLFTLGWALVGWCAWLFRRIGRGTPNPFTAKTRRMVTGGPYGVVRNPMMWGVGAVLTGLALILGSAGLWFGFASFLGFVLWFVPRYEEPDMERRFGEEFRDYRRRVPRWWPRRAPPAG